MSFIPAPRPFSPFSSSSSRRKLRGTVAPIFVALWLWDCSVMGVRKWDVRPAIELVLVGVERVRKEESWPRLVGVR